MMLEKRPTQKETVMIIKRLLASWNKICPGCNLARKYPQSFIGKIIRTHWEKGCPSHKAYIELYGQKDAKPKNEVSLSAEV
jgi:hypothetical protein